MAKSNNSSSVSGIVFVGCLFLGVGLGALVDRAGSGTLIGLGAGFVAMALIRAKASK